MAGSQEMTSSFVEGLEDISEEEQLKMALEMSKNDVYGQSSEFEPSPTNMSVDSNRSETAEEESRFAEWIRTPVEDRLQLLAGAGATSENVREPDSETISVNVNNDTYDSDSPEDEDDVLKRIIEQSKHDLFLSDEDKTKIAMEQSELEAVRNVPMDTLDENEQLEAAIKMSLGATYERLMSSSVPKSVPVSLVNGNPRTTRPPSNTPPSATPPSSSPPVFKVPQKTISEQLERARSRPTSLASQPREPCAQLWAVPSEEQLPSSSPTGSAMYISPPSSPPPVHIRPPDSPPTRSPSLPCPLPARVKSQLNIATSPNRFSPLAASPTSPRRLGTGFPPLSEDEQLEMALKMSQEEAECNKKDVRLMSEEDQLQLAMRLSRSESASAVGGFIRQTGRQKRASGSGSGGGMHHLTGTRSLPPLAPSQSSPSLPSQFKQRQPSQHSSSAVSQPGRSSVIIQPSSSARSQSNSAASSEQHSPGELRVIVVDGSNVGMAMGRNEVFRAQALTIVYAHFAKQKHEVVIFLPKSRWNRSAPKDRELLDRLEKKEILFYTPTRKTDTTCWDVYDDRYIVAYAAKQKGIIVTNDNYRDLIAESDEFRDQIQNRLLPFTWVKEQFLPPDDPLGKNGPRLAQFLRH